MVKTLRNLYWEHQLDELIQGRVVELKLPSKSEFVRLILKKEFKKCIYDGCYGEAVFNDLCQMHLNKISKKIKNNGGQNETTKI